MLKKGTQKTVAVKEVEKDKKPSKFRKLVEKLTSPFRKKKPEQQSNQTNGGGVIQTLWNVPRILKKVKFSKSKEAFTAADSSQETVQQNMMVGQDYGEFLQDDAIEHNPYEAIRQQAIKEEIHNDQLEKQKKNAIVAKPNKQQMDSHVVEYLKKKGKKQMQAEYDEYMKNMDITESFENYQRLKQLQNNNGLKAEKWEPFEKRRIDSMFDLSNEKFRAPEIYQRIEEDVKANPEYQERKKQVFEYLSNNDVDERTYTLIMSNLKRFEDRSEKAKYFNPENFKKPIEEARNFNDLYMSRTSYLGMMKQQRDMNHQKVTKIAQNIKSLEKRPYNYQFSDLTTGF